MNDETRLAVWTSSTRNDDQPFLNPLGIPQFPHLDWVLQEVDQYIKMDLTAWLAKTDWEHERWTPSWIQDVRYRSRQLERHAFVLSWDWYEHARHIKPSGAISVWFESHEIVAIEPHLGSIHEHNFKHFPSLFAEMSKVPLDDEKYFRGSYDNHTNQIYGLYYSALLLQQQYAHLVREQWFESALRLLTSMYAEKNDVSEYAYGQLQFPDKTIQKRLVQEIKAASALMYTAHRSDQVRSKHREIKELRLKAIKADTKQSKTEAHLYVMKLGNALKIGISVDPKRRRKELSVGPSEVRLLASTPLANARDAERYLHKALDRHKLRNEWFADCPEVRNRIRRFVPRLANSEGQKS